MGSGFGKDEFHVKSHSIPTINMNRLTSNEKYC
jgi:hypothetical protein